MGQPSFLPDRPFSNTPCEDQHHQLSQTSGSLQALFPPSCVLFPFLPASSWLSGKSSLVLVLPCPPRVSVCLLPDPRWASVRAPGASSQPVHLTTTCEPLGPGRVSSASLALRAGSPQSRCQTCPA